MNTDTPAPGTVEPVAVTAEVLPSVEIIPAIHSFLLAVAPEQKHTSTNPALAYLASLSATGRRTMRLRLEQVAQLLIGSKDLTVVPWAALRFEHVAALRSKLEEL